MLRALNNTPFGDKNKIVINRVFFWGGGNKNYKINPPTCPICFDDPG
jgi:hypothetical protein